jgi:hypothetical protein
MWSWSGAIIKDLQEFAHVVAGDTSQIVNSAVGAVLAPDGPAGSTDDDCQREAAAAHVVAGDEDLPENQFSRLPKRRILHLQTSEDVFRHPLEESEKYRLGQWVHASRATDQTWQAAVLTDSAELRAMYSILVEDEQVVTRDDFFQRYLARLRQLRLAFSTRSVLKGSSDTNHNDSLQGWADDDDDDVRTKAKPHEGLDERLDLGKPAAVIDELSLLRKCNAELRCDNAKLRAEVLTLRDQLRVAHEGRPFQVQQLQQEPKAETVSGAVRSQALAPSLQPPSGSTAADDDDDWTNLS